MLIFYMGFSVVMYFSGLLSFSIKRKHLLLMLLSLELIILSLFFNLFLYLSYMNYEYFFSMVFLTMSVCEGALGLSILVSLIRTHGNDYFQTFNVLW
uniref:NADH-ubiquinone oxidoreductase chain 4L n=1 Tax=Cheironitis hoplosternus TaxID=206730 RepID=A0A1X9HDM1_9SCAR|nr:NADH deshydrogenase subunit 4L [Cheironitis hoplosternus]